MKPIKLGDGPDGKPFTIDLKIALRTRFLVQAASGGGKSRTLRRLAEQFFGKVQTFVIDKEGEFPSLREKFGYVLAGKGGETPADPRSAELLCHRLLEHNASAVFDLYNLKDPDRHLWVKLFLDALMNAPKKLWRPIAVMVDESHRMCPEKGQGESVAKDAMIDLAVDGRKRGYAAFFFTQRLAKVSKNATGELLNRLVGQTVEDNDVDRAIDLMSVRRADREEFEYGIKRLKPGNFWAFGPALCIDRTLVHIGPVVTTHPEPGSPAAAAPPPTPDKLKALLPKLVDLPKEVEIKAKTEADLKAEIRTLKLELARKPKAAPAPSPVVKQVTKTVELKVPVVKKALVTRLEAALEKTQKAIEKVRSLGAPLDTLAKEVKVAVDAGKTMFFEARMKAIPAPPLQTRIPEAAVAAGKVRVLAKKETVVLEKRVNGDEETGLGKPERAVLSVLAQHEEGCAIGKLALLSGYRISGGFRNSLAALRTGGFMAGSNGGVMTITREGLSAIAGQVEPLPEGQALVDYWLRHPSFDGAARKTLGVLVENPDGLKIAELAADTGYQVSGGFRNALSKLRTAGVLVGKNKETMRACDLLLEAVGA